MKIEGDIKDISEKQLQFITSVIEQRGFGEADVTVEPVGKPGDNYVATVKRIIVQQDGEEKMRIIAKIAPTLEAVRMMGNIPQLFNNENLIYTEVLPKFTELEKSADIPEDEKLRYATCFGCFMEPLHEVILLEDLQVSGFVMLDRFKSLTDNDIKLVLKNFAMLHSVSYVLKHREPETFDVFKSNLSNVWELFHAGQMTMFFAQIENDVMAILDNQDYKDALKGIVSKVGDNMVKLYKMDGGSRYTVVQHGDSWTNNFMFQLEDGSSTQCCMIDYQQSRVNTPVADLVYMLFSCTDYETRAKHFIEWIDYYHSELDQRLNNFGLKANYVYPRDQLDADLKRHGKASLGQAVLLASMMVRESAEAAKFKEAMEQGVTLDEMMKNLGASSMNTESIIKYKSKLEGLVDSHRELGLI